VANFKTMEQVLEAENERLKKQVTTLHTELLFAVTRMMINGIDVTVQQKMERSEWEHLWNAGDLMLKMFPHIPIPKEVQRPFLALPEQGY
jgi:hypothetical protein